MVSDNNSNHRKEFREQSEEFLRAMGLGSGLRGAIHRLPDGVGTSGGRRRSPAIPPTELSQEHVGNM